ncbi:MAG: hypothetical protein WC564_05220 [Patescibacteria group bacterium]
MNSKKIFLIACCILAGILISSFFLSVHVWFYVAPVLLIIVLWLASLFLRKKKSVPIPIVEKEVVAVEPEKVEVVDLKNLSRTAYLVKCGEDVVLNPDIAIDDPYLDLFAPWNSGDHIFPAIDPLFEELLKKDCIESGRIMRAFSIVRPGYDPIGYFWSFDVNLVSLSLQASTILRYFLDNKVVFGDRNWFLLNTRPDEDETRMEDLRIVDIKLLGNGKYFIYCYPCRHWSSFGGGWLDLSVDNKFIIPVA